jgi:predicted porin
MGVSQRKLLATAVASACALPAAALAQVPGWIQIYGRANVSYEYITTKNSSNTAVQPNQSNWDLVDNSSRIGFRGNKDLGGGLTGLFQMESRVRLNTGSNAFLTSRDSYAGLAGGYGTVRLGRTIGPVYYANYDYISMHNHDTGTSSDALLAPAVIGAGRGFMNRTVWYTSPKLGAFTVDVAYSLLDGARLTGVSSQPRYLGLVGSYDQGPLHLAASYANTKNSDLLSPGVANDDKAYTFGGLYDFKTFVVGALIENAKSKTVTGSDAKRNYFRVSAMLPVGKNEFHVNLGTVNHGIGGIGNGTSTSNDGAKQWTVAYNYNITKETKVYGFYTRVHNDANGQYSLGTGTANVSPTPVAGLEISSIAIGVRHNF